MKITIGKILALVIVLVYAWEVLSKGLTINALQGCIGLLLPFALIWFPEQIGSFSGYVGRGGNVNIETPPVLISPWDGSF